MYRSYAGLCLEFSGFRSFTVLGFMGLICALFALNLCVLYALRLYSGFAKMQGWCGFSFGFVFMFASLVCWGWYSMV